MPILIKYEQARPVPGQLLPVPSPDQFIFHMQLAFGAFPVELTKEHIERLEGMKATWPTALTRNPYETLIIAIKRIGAIKVWADKEETHEQVGHDAGRQELSRGIPDTNIPEEISGA